MPNKIKELRLAFLLSPRQFAERLGIYPDYVPRLESGAREINEVWIDAVARALGAPREAVADPAFDISCLEGSALPPGQGAPVCAVGVRYALLALVAKLGGMEIAKSLSEDEIADATIGLVDYMFQAAEANGQNGTKSPLNHLSQGLQIVSLTILQSRGVEPGQDFQYRMNVALPSAAQLAQGFHLAHGAGLRPEK